MCTIVTSLDMTSFVYIGDEKHHLSKWLGKEKKYPSKKKLCCLYWEIEESKDELQKCWINQATVSKFKKRFYCRARLKTYNEVTGKDARVQSILQLCGLGNWILDRSRQLISTTTVNLGIVCKLKLHSL